MGENQPLALETCVERKEQVRNNCTRVVDVSDHMTPRRRLAHTCRHATVRNTLSPTRMDKLLEGSPDGRPTYSKAVDKLTLGG
jgi:hypothetical protein